MKRVFFFVLSMAAMAAAGPYLPQNVTTHVCSVTVAADDTAYTNPVALAGYSYKVLKVAYKDTSIAKQDTIDAGDAFKIYLQHGFIIGRPFANYYQDTLWTKMGDTTGSAFLHNYQLSSDSLICESMDTTKTVLAEIGNPGDSVQVSIGYHSVLPDPAALNRFMVIGASDIANTLRVYVILNILQGSVIWENK